MKYKELRDLRACGSSGQKIVWHDSKCSGEKWLLKIPRKNLRPLCLLFQGTCYVTGGFSFHLDPSEDVKFFDSGISDKIFRQRVEFLGSG